MRVLLVLDDGLAPPDQRTAARNWAPIFGQLKKQGIEFGVAAFRDGSEMLSAADGLAAERHALNWTDARPFGALRRLRGVVRRGFFDIVDAHEVKASLASVAATIGLGRRPPVVFHRHHGFCRGLGAVATSAAGRATHRTFAVSETVAVFAQHHIPKRKIRVVYNGVPQPRFVAPDEVERIRQHVRLAPSEKLAVWVGRLREEKNLPLLIESAFVARQLSTDLHLAIVGAGPFEAQLQSLVADHQGWVHCVGYQHDVAPWYAAADVVVFSSDHEACPLTALEAMASGRAVVAPATDGYMDLIEDTVTGLLAPRAETVALGQALAAVVGNPKLAERLGAAGRERHQRLFSIERSVTELIRAYRGVLNDTEVHHR